MFLTDFGLAKNVATGSRYTRTGATLGTPAYMSPEQARGELTELTAASDVWALGCLLYELLSGGRKAFEGDTPAAQIGAVLTTQPRPLRQSRPELPKGVEELVAACLAKAAGARPASADALRTDLERVARGDPPAHRRPRNRRTRFVAAGAATLLAVAVTIVAVWPAPTQPTPPVPQESAAERQAQMAWQIRRTEPARSAKLFAEALRGEAGRWDWRLQYGLVLWGLGDNARAHAAWEAVPPGVPERGAARLYRGLATVVHCMAAERPVEAARPFFAEAAQSGDWAGRIAQAGLAFCGDDRPAAVAALEHEPRWEGAILYALSITDTKAVNRERKLQAYDRVLLEGFNAAWIHSNRGTEWFALGNRHEAEAAFKRAIVLSPRFVRAHLNLAVLHEESGDPAAAMAVLSAALQANPGSVEVLVARGTLYRNLGNLDAALADYDTALKSEPTHVTALVNRSSLLQTRGDLDGALRDIDAALRLAPNHPVALHNRGLVKQKRGDVAGAIADIQAAVQADPAYAEGHAALGLVLMGQRDYEAAVRAFDAGFAVNPKLPQILMGRALSLLRLGRYEAALTDLAAARTVVPRSGPTLDHIKTMEAYARQHLDGR